ncbi:MAG: hypothetical protein NC124_12980 [Clostridium sp.]|nr:hypothetical protein [Clostridium sp.]
MQQSIIRCKLYKEERPFGDRRSSLMKREIKNPIIGYTDKTGVVMLGIDEVWCER